MAATNAVTTTGQTPVFTNVQGGNSPHRDITDSAKRGEKNPVVNEAQKTHETVGRVALPELGVHQADPLTAEFKDKCSLKEKEKEKEVGASSDRFQGVTAKSRSELLKAIGLTSANHSLGAGATGSVGIYEHTSGQTYAVKLLDEKKALQGTEGERKMLRANVGPSGRVPRGEAVATQVSGDHPNILKTYGLILYNEKTKEYRVATTDFKSTKDGEETVVGTLTQLVPGSCELFDHIQNKRKLPVEEVRNIGRQLASALAHLHAQGISHRDIKPENVLYSPATGQVMLIDFGFMRNLKDAEGGRTKTMCGSPSYVAPEVMQGKGYGTQADLWSFGVTLYVMAVGQFPFDGYGSGDVRSLMQEVVYFERSNVSFSMKAAPDRKYDFLKLPVDLKQLINRLIAPEGRRLTAEGALNSSFLAEKH